MSANRIVASISIERRFMTRSNMSSQIVQRLGFIWLRLIPIMRNGKDSGPRRGIGRCICCQQPLHILASPVVCIMASQLPAVHVRSPSWGSGLSSGPPEGALPQASGLEAAVGGL